MLEQDFKEHLKQRQLLLPKQSNHEFLEAMETVFQVSCIFGVLGSKRFIAFVWAAFILCLLIFIEGSGLLKSIKIIAGLIVDPEGQRSVAARLSGCVFYAFAIWCQILASKLFYNWPALAAAWTKVEHAMALKVPSDGTLKKRMYLVTLLWFFCSFVEHAMSMVALIGLDCPRELVMKKYILYSHGFMLLHKDYAEWYAIPLSIINTFATFLWNFQDVLIVLICMGLTSRYRRINQCLASLCAADKKQTVFNQKTESAKLFTWRKLREAYVKQSYLVRKVDSAIGGIIVLSCICNFYFIWLQLFLGITQAAENYAIKNVYYVVSLLWLGVRVTWVVLAASDVNVHSQLALQDIFMYDTHAYNVEVDRLQDQLRKEYIALSGMGFFYLNKTILLQMAGVIITYELVLIQYDYRESGNIHNNILNITVS